VALDDLPTVKPSVLVMLVPFETLFKIAATVSKREELERNKRQGKEHRPPRRASTARKATTRKIKKKEKKKKVDERWSNFASISLRESASSVSISCAALASY